MANNHRVFCMRRLLDYDPLTRESVYVDYHERTGEMELYHEQDCAPIIEANKARQNDPDKFARQMRKGRETDTWLYASVPNIIIHKWRKELGVDLFNRDHEAKVFQLLNSPEYRWLKATSKSHVVK